MELSFRSTLKKKNEEDKLLNSGSGIAGGEYEVKQLLLYLLKAYLSKERKFELYHGKQRYLKLDDIVLKTDTCTILGQAKNKKAGTVTKKDFFVKHGEFNLIVYLETFKSIFLTDLKLIHEKLLTVNRDEINVLISQIERAFENGDDSYEKYFEELITEMRNLNATEVLELLTSFGKYEIHLITNILPSMEFKKFRKDKYYCFNTEEFTCEFREVIKGMKKIIPNAFLISFLGKLQLHVINDIELETTIQDILEKLQICDIKHIKLIYDFLYNEIKIWSQNPKRKGLSKLDVDAYFTSFNSEIFTDELKKYENDIDFTIRFKSLLPMKKKSILTVVKTYRYSSILEKLFENFPAKAKGRIQVVDHNSGLDHQKKSATEFLHPKYSHYICPLTNNNEELIDAIMEMFQTIKLNKKLNKTKKIILFSEVTTTFERLEEVDIIQDLDIRNDFNISSLLNNNLNVEESAQADYLLTIVKTPRYFLIMAKLQKEWSTQISKKQIIFLNPLLDSENQRRSVESFDHEKYTHILCPLLESNKDLLEYIIRIFTRIKSGVLKNYKRIVLFAEIADNLGVSKDIYVMEDNEWFQDLEFKMLRQPCSMGDLEKYYISRNISLSNTSLPRRYSEEAFLKTDQKIYLISSSPGMGKTSLMSSLACRINRGNKFWAIKLELNRFSNLLHRHSEVGTVPDIVDFLVIERKSIFQQQISTISDSVILLVDGIDEISPDFFDLIVKFLEKTVGTVKKVFMTTRGHLQKQLEEKFEVGSFIINELSSYDICALISRFSSYSQYDVQQWYDGDISWALKDFLKIPLHAKMFAELYFQEAMLRSSDLNMNLGKLYEFFFHKKQEIFMKDKSSYSGNVSQRQALEYQFEQHLKNCKEIAIKDFFNEEDLEKMEIRMSLITNIDEKFCRMGILEYSSVHKTYTFGHRTFIEYFVAKWIMEKIYDAENGNQKILSVLFLHILLNNEWKTIRQFLEYNLEKNWALITDGILETSERIVSDMEFFETEENWKRLFFDDNAHLLNLICGKSDKKNQVLKFCLEILPSYSKEELQRVYVIAENSDINIKDDKGSTILHYAAESGNIDLVRVIMNNKNFVDIDVEDNNGYTPLHLAIQKDKSEMAQFLIEKGASANKMCRNGWTSLHFAALTNNKKILRYLLQNQVDMTATVKDNCSYSLILETENTSGWNAAHIAAYCGHMDFFKLLYGMKKPLPVTFNGINYLHLAVKRNHTELTKYIISEKICEIQGKTSDGWNVAHFAAKSGNLSLMKYFVLSNVNVNEKTFAGHNILHLAAQSGNLDLVKYLSDFNVKIEEKTSAGENVLHFAAQSENLDLLKYFLVLYLRVEEETLDGLHDLYFVAQSGNDGLMKNIQDIKNRVNEKTFDGWNILHFAVRKGNLELVKYLIGIKVKIYENTSDNWTVLHLAAQSGNIDLLKYFIDLGLGMDVRTSTGESVFDIADRYGNLHLLRQLFVYPEFLDATMSEIFNDALSGEIDLSEGLLRIIHRIEHLDVSSFHYEESLKQGMDYVKYLDNRKGKNSSHLYHGMIYLHAAIRSGYMELIKYISFYMCSMHEKLCDDETILHYVVRVSTDEILKYFLDNSLDIEAKNTYGETVTDLASYLGKEETTKFLKTYRKYHEYYYFSKNFYIFIKLQNAATEGNFNLFKSTYAQVKDRPQQRIKNKNYLHAAATSGNTALIKYIISQNICDIQETTTYDETVLHFVAFNCNPYVVEYFISRHLKADHKTSEGWTALHYAVWGGNVEVFNYLIGLNLKIDEKTVDGKTIIHFAARGGYLRFVKYLTKLRINIKETTLKGESVLHFAALSGNIELVKYLISLNFNIHQKTHDGETILHYAAFGGNVDIVEYLVDLNVGINDETSDGKTALHYAAWSGDLAVVKHLVSSGMDLERKTFEGETPLHFAALSGNLEVVKYLVSLRAKIMVKSNSGETILHYAADSGHLDVVKYIVDLNVDTDVISKYGKRAYDVAMEGDNFEVSQFLIMPCPKNKWMPDNINISFTQREN